MLESPPQFLHPNGEYISDQIRATGKHYEATFLQRILSEFNVRTFVDVGANLGNHTHFVEFSGGTGYAFEPEPRNFNLLLRNSPNFKAFNVALSDKNGSGQLITFESCLGNCYLGEVFGGRSMNFGTDIGSHTCEIEVLDSFRIQDATFLKIDAEGSELKVLLGARQTIIRTRPTIWIESQRSGLKSTKTTI
jgi:FkbM family methyltransferase